MIKLSGYESSVLAFLAQRPDNYGAYIDSLGSEAKEVALCIVGVSSGPPAAMETARAILTWAKANADRQNGSRGLDRLAR